jgi:oxygen-independent coproporphyrinogen-3 oxidase
MIASLYIHIPFCKSICDYCDFYSIPVSEKHDAALLDSFIDAIIDDIKDQLDIFCVDKVPSIYIGGGTPSVLGVKHLELLLASIAALLKLRSNNIEFTIEANPESADRDFLRCCIEGGINRISLGIQTFHEPSRQTVHRVGAADLLEQRLALAAEYFPGTFSVDLITGLPYQTNDILHEDIKRILAYQPAHVSLYSLSLEPGTPLGKKVTQFEVALPGNDEADKLWLCGRDALEKSGYIQYEVSNFALPGKTCTHNLRYWHMENWLGIGPAASGTIIDDAMGSGKRFTYPHNIKSYLAAPMPRINHANVEELDRDTLIKESLLMGFRYNEGPDPHLFKQRFGKSIKACIPKTISRWRERGFFANDNNLAPSPQGMLFLNSFLREAFYELGLS